jgi:hypothetical protein
MFGGTHDFTKEEWLDMHVLVRRLMVEHGYNPDDPEQRIVQPLVNALAFGRRLERAIAAGVRTCRVCGCTEHDACFEAGLVGDKRGCAWAGPNVCTVCLPHFAPVLAEALA